MKRFPSKIDPWIGALLTVPPVASVATLIGLYRSGEPDVWSGWVGVIFVVVLYVGLVFPIYYELEEESLLIRFGMMRSRIPYASIRKVEPTRNPLSSPALSLDRLHIDAGNPLGPNISPRDKAEFLAALVQKTPHLKVEGGRLLPR